MVLGLVISYSFLVQVKSSIHVAEYSTFVIADFTASVGRFKLVKVNPFSTDFNELTAYPTALFGTFLELFGKVSAYDVPIGRRGRFHTAYAVGIGKRAIHLRQFNSSRFDDVEAIAFGISGINQQRQHIRALKLDKTVMAMLFVSSEAQHMEVNLMRQFKVIPSLFF